MIMQYERKPKTLPKYLTKTKVDEILNKARERSTKDYLILVTMFRTGMRCSDLVNIIKRDVHVDEITVRLGKGKKDRVIPIDKGLYDLLMLHSASLNLEDKLFPVTESRIRQICNKYKGHEGLHPHMLRHSYAVHCIKSGMNVRVLQKILGHNELSTTAVYLDLVADDLKEEHKKIMW